jgi:RNA polymerase sigma-70 factor, ECF subfamily
MGMPEQPRSELELSRLIDAELVRVARDGSASALRLIIRRHNQRLYRVARAIVRDDSEAEDVMQEAYLSAFANLAKFRTDASLATWLTRIVVNKAINRLQREDVVVPLEAVEHLEPAAGHIIGMSHRAFEFDPEATAARSQVRDLLERAIDDLPEPFRVVFVMRMVEELSVKETASSLGIPEETVKSRFHRAKKMMREQLEPTLASALTDIFKFQDPRCGKFTDALVARIVGKTGPPDRPPQHSYSQTRRKS